MGLTAKWTVKWTVNQAGKSRLRRSRLLSTLLSIPRQIQHITLDVHPVEREADLASESALTKGGGLRYVHAFPICPDSIIPNNSVAISSTHENHGYQLGAISQRCVGAKNMDFCGWVDPEKSWDGFVISRSPVRSRRVAPF